MMRSASDRASVSSESVMTITEIRRLGMRIQA